MKTALVISLLVICCSVINSQTTCPSNCKTNDCSSRGLCSECADGFYGIRCDKPCPQNCIKTRCIRYNVKCTLGCKTGWFGDKCFQRCESCTNGCHRDSGICEADGNVADDSFNKTRNQSAPDCNHPDRCEDCYDLTNSRLCSAGCKGDNCSQQCSTRCIQCDRYTEGCTVCEAGWYGSTCHLQCPTSCSGQGCPIDGICLDNDATTNHTESSYDSVSVQPDIYISTLPASRKDIMSDWRLQISLAACVLSVTVLTVIITVRCFVVNWKKKALDRRLVLVSRVGNETDTSLQGDRMTLRSNRNERLEHERDSSYLHAIQSERDSSYLHAIQPEYNDIRVEDTQHVSQNTFGSWYRPDHTTRRQNAGVWLENRHDVSQGPPVPPPRVRQVPSHYDKLNFVMYDEPNQIYTGLSNNQTSQL